jgi:hypothetical protein
MASVRLDKLGRCSEDTVSARRFRLGCGKKDRDRLWDVIMFVCYFLRCGYEG